MKCLYATMPRPLLGNEGAGVAAMTIRHFILGAFEPEAIAAMSEALEAACKRFQDTGPPGEGIRETIARRILAAAEGAAGSLIESATKLTCTIDPNEIRQKAGGGAQCAFETGQ
jgi:hypothetical protein